MENYVIIEPDYWLNSLSHDPVQVNRSGSNDQVAKLKSSSGQSGAVENT